MMYTLKELLKDYKGKYEGLEVSLYKKNEKNEYVGQGQGYEESEVKEYELMDESTYQSDIDWKADFEGRYGDKNAKCLVVILKNPYYVLKTEESIYDEDEIEEVKDYFTPELEEVQDEKYEEYCREVKECVTLKELYDVLMQYDDYSNAGAYDLRLEDINE